MKVDVYTWENSEGYLNQSLFINGKVDSYVYPLCDCPEDAIIGRDLKDCGDLAAYIKKGYEAAKNGEELEIEYHDQNTKPLFSE